MISQEDLYDLAHSLSFGEKRHVTLFLGSDIFRKKDDYASMFKKLCGIKQKTAIRQDPFWRENQINCAKLYERILLALRLFDQNQNKLDEYLLYAKILINRGLEKQAKNYISKTRKLSQEYDEDLIGLEVSLMQRKANLALRIKNLGQEAEKLRKESEAYFERLEMFLKKFTEWEMNIIALKYKQTEGNNVKDKYDFYLSNDTKKYLENSISTESFDAINHGLRASATYYKHFKKDLDYTKSFEATILLIKKFEEKKGRIKRNWKKYFELLTQGFNTGLQLLVFNIEDGKLNRKLSKEIESTLNKMQNFEMGARSKQSGKEQSLVFSERMFSELNYLIVTNKYKDALKLLPSFEEGLKNHRNLIKPYRRLAIYVNISLTYLLNRKIEEAIIWNKKNEEFSKYVIYDYIQLLNVIFGFEKLNNEEDISMLISKIGVLLIRIRESKHDEGFKKIANTILFKINEASLQGRGKLDIFIDLDDKLTIFKAETKLHASYFIFKEIHQWVKMKIEEFLEM